MYFCVKDVSGLSFNNKVQKLIYALWSFGLVRTCLRGGAVLQVDAICHHSVKKDSEMSLKTLNAYIIVLHRNNLGS